MEQSAAWGFLSAGPSPFSSGVQDMCSATTVIRGDKFFFRSDYTVSQWASDCFDSRSECGAQISGTVYEGDGYCQAVAIHVTG